MGRKILFIVVKKGFTVLNEITRLISREKDIYPESLSETGKVSDKERGMKLLKLIVKTIIFWGCISGLVATVVFIWFYIAKYPDFRAQLNLNMTINRLVANHQPASECTIFIEHERRNGVSYEEIEKELNDTGRIDKQILSVCKEYLEKNEEQISKEVYEFLINCKNSIVLFKQMETFHNDGKIPHKMYKALNAFKQRGNERRDILQEASKQYRKRI